MRACSNTQIRQIAGTDMEQAVLWTCKYFSQIGIRESVILNYESGSGRPSNCRSGQIRIRYGHIDENMLFNAVPSFIDIPNFDGRQIWNKFWKVVLFY